MKLSKIILAVILICTLIFSNNISFAVSLNQEIANIIEAYYEWTQSSECQFDENGQVNEAAAANKLNELCNSDLNKLNALYTTYTAEDLQKYKGIYGSSVGWPGGDTSNIICKSVSRAINNAKSGTTSNPNSDKNQDKEKIREKYKEVTNAGNNVTQVQLKEVDNLIKNYVANYGQLRNETDQDMIGWAEWISNKLKELGSTEETAYEQYKGEQDQRQENNETVHRPSTGVLGTSTPNGGHTIDEVINEGGNFIDIGKNQGSKISTGNLQAGSNTLYNILLGIGVFLTVAVGMYLAIKFMIASAEEKAQVKESLIPYIAGCIVIFGAFTIWKLAITLLSGIS